MVEYSDYVWDYVESFGGSLFGGSPASSPVSAVSFRGVAVAPAALAWRSGCSAWLRCECVLASGRVVVSSVPASSWRSAASRARAAVSGSGVLRASLFLSDGRWVCSALA